MTLESINRSIADLRANRRQALAGGLGAAALAFTGATTLAQDSTPTADVTEDGDGSPMFLFVQLAESGTWTPSADDPEVYDLRLTGIGSQTVFFSDRPERIVGTVDTAKFLDNLGFTPVNPPNAAAVVRTLEGERDVLVIELFDPVYTREFDADGGGSLSYKARVLDAYHGDSLISWYDEQDDPELPSEFDQVSLFIDDCPPFYSCIGAGQQNYGPIPGGPFGACFDWGDGVCLPCWHPMEQLSGLCNDAYPDCQGACNGG